MHSSLEVNKRTRWLQEVTYAQKPKGTRQHTKRLVCGVCAVERCKACSYTVKSAYEVRAVVSMEAVSRVIQGVIKAWD